MKTQLLLKLSNLSLRKHTGQQAAFKEQFDTLAEKYESPIALIKEIASEKKTSSVIYANLSWTIRHHIIGDAQSFNKPEKSEMKQILAISMTLHEQLLHSKSHKLLEDCL